MLCHGPRISGGGGSLSEDSNPRTPALSSGKGDDGSLLSVISAWAGALCDCYSQPARGDSRPLFSETSSSSSAVDQPYLDPQSTCCHELGGAAQVFRRSPQLVSGWLTLRP